MRLLILALLVVLWAVPAGAACGGSSPTWTAADATRDEVAACVTAASAGDTINVPAGSATWSSAVTVSKAVSIIGAGSGVGGTILTSSMGTDTVANFFRVTNLTTNALVRISGFRFTLTATQYLAVSVSGSVELGALRIDHNRFDHGTYQLQAWGSRGVIDHNDFYNSNIAISFSAGSTAAANASWASMAAGTSGALFIEDNNFIDDANYLHASYNEKIGTENGGKLVVRYNHFDFDNWLLAPGLTSLPFMAHGSAAQGVPNGYWQQGTGASRGQSVIEFYNNTMHGKRIDFLYVSRGSANLVHHNAVTGTLTNAPRIYFYEEEQTVSQWNPLRTDWPAEDQVHNSFIWANTYNGSAYFNTNDHIAIGGDSATYIIEDRDYFLHEPQSSGGSESFTGANGASNTYPTNGVVYPTLGTMTFSASGPNAYYGYVPYTYPHPLTGSAVPKAPTNVRIR